MYSLSHRIKFSAGHFLRDYDGICKNPHGHNWEVLFNLEGRELSANGMLVDFYDIDRVVKPIHQKLDHAFLNDFAPFDKISPTSENLAYWIYEETVEALTFDRARLVSVTVKEYEDSVVTYRPA